MNPKNTTSFTFLTLLFMIIIWSCENSGNLASVLEEKESVVQEISYSPEVQKVFDELKSKDSLIFSLGFNHCDTSVLNMIISEDMEFYHDQGGLNKSKAVFMEQTLNLCQLDYKPTRKLVENSLKVFPLYNNGKLYGAIQTGEHEFYGKEEGKPIYLTSTAKFTHVWMLEEEDWKLQRILSYDHQSPEN